jgi:four helix bundle protein
MPQQSYRNLIVWQKAMALVTEIYCKSNSFPRDEIYGLTSQLRRAAISVPSNIAEGQGKLTRGEFRQFLGHARASLFEVQTQIQIACNLGYMDNETASDLLDRSVSVAQLLHGLMKSLKAE